MNHFTQHVPNFVDTDARNSFNFEDLADLCSKLSMTSENMQIHGKNPPYALMIVSKDERWWWVIGHVMQELDLPYWDGAWHNVIDKEGNEFEIRSSHIHWYDGVIGELTDGREVKFVE